MSELTLTSNRSVDGDGHQNDAATFENQDRSFHI